MNRRLGKCSIGTSGYQYDHWQGVFYPRALPKSRWFAYYAERFDAVEINNTFYRLPQAETFDSWRRQAPPGFHYAVKFSRYGTHLKKLKDPEQSVGRFAERAARLGRTLEAVLVQLPPRWRADAARLDAFLAAAPRRWRWAVEFRDPSWLNDEVFQTLRRRGAALCIHDLIPDHPWRLTAGWTYLRFHGAGAAAGHGGDYPRPALKELAQRIAALRQEGADVYAYFNNDLHGYAVANARDLQAYLTDQVPPAAKPPRRTR